jgi:hypothetical protein
MINILSRISGEEKRATPIIMKYYCLVAALVLAFLASGKYVYS